MKQVYLDSERSGNSRSLQRWLHSIAGPLDILGPTSKSSTTTTTTTTTARASADPSRIHHSLVIHNKQTQGVSFVPLVDDNGEAAKGAWGSRVYVHYIMLIRFDVPRFPSLSLSLQLCPFVAASHLSAL